VVRELQRKVRHAERLAALGTLAAGVAHEIRNPLFGISATAQILGREIPEGSPLRPLCQGMLDETRRVNDLVTNLVAYGRPQEPKFRPVDPDRLIEEAIASVAARARESRCDISHADGEASGEAGVGAAGELPRFIEVDPDQIKQVLINLLLNAFDAAPGGRVRIGVTWDEPGGNVRLFVSDSGPGIPADQIDKVFDLFYTTKVRGSGMGLALSARIIQEHGGSISAGNAPDGGALFEVRLPRRRVERRDGMESPA
jgi:signal transduction histidine kinase